MKVTMVGGLFTLAAVILGALLTHWFGLATPSIQSTPTQSSTSSSSALTSPTATATAPASVPVTVKSGIYYQGPVTLGVNSRDFNTSPPSPSSSPDAFSYSGFQLITGSSTAGFAAWKQSSTPTAAECETFATANMIGDLANVTAGMKICFETDQGRVGLLIVQPGTSEDTLNGIATVWGS